MSASRFRFTFSDGCQVAGPVQGCGGMVSDHKRLLAAWQLAKKEEEHGLYEPAAGCVHVFPAFDAHDNGPPYLVDLRDVVRIQPEGAS